MGKIVYLDQKAWIDLAKSNNETQDFVLNASETGSAIFPLSIIHAEETSRISDPKRRRKLASLMVKISKGYSFSPYVTVNIEGEVKQLVMEKLGLPITDLDKQILGKGICHLIGARPRIEWGETGIDLDVSKKLEKELIGLLDSPKCLLLALTSGRMPKSYRKLDIEAVARMEKIRKELLQIKDNTLRRRFVFAKFLSDFMTPILAKVSAEMKLSMDFIISKNWTEEEFRGFLDRVPTALCLFTLLLERDQQLQRPIQANDLNDIWALSLALPYSHIVVTENMWTSISRQTKIDKKCGTIILTSIEELIEHL